MKGQLFNMVIVAVPAGVGFWLIGVPLAVTLGIIADLTNIIRYVGTFLSGIPEALIALTAGMDAAICTSLLFLAVQQFDGHILMPII